MDVIDGKEGRRRDNSLLSETTAAMRSVVVQVQEKIRGLIIELIVVSAMGGIIEVRAGGTTNRKLAIRDNDNWLMTLTAVGGKTGGVRSVEDDGRIAERICDPLDLNIEFIALRA